METEELKGVVKGPWKFAPRNSELRRLVREASERGRVSRADLEDYYENGAKTIRWWDRFIPRPKATRGRSPQRRVASSRALDRIAWSIPLGFVLGIGLVLQHIFATGGGPALTAMVGIVALIVVLQLRPTRRRGHRRRRAR